MLPSAEAQRRMETEILPMINAGLGRAVNLFEEEGQAALKDLTTCKTTDCVLDTLLTE